MTVVTIVLLTGNTVMAHVTSVMSFVIIQLLVSN